MEPIADRIYQFFYKHKGYKNDTVIAKELGYSHPEKISRLFREGKPAKPSVDILEDITKKFGEELSIEWLLTGHGEMIRSASYLVNDPAADYVTPGSAPAKGLLLLINKELQTLRSSLETIEKAVQATVRSGTGKDPSSERVPLGSKNRAGSKTAKK